MSGSKTIREMFQERDTQFEEHVTKIRKYLEPTLDGLEEFFNLKEDKENGWFSWEVFEVDGEDMLIVGTVRYKPGDVLAFGDQPIEVTAENAHMLERIFRFVVPIALADKQSCPETIKHMTKVIAENQNDAEQAQQIQSGITVADEPEFATPEFDLEGLTDEQKEKLFLSTGFKN